MMKIRHFTFVALALLLGFAACDDENLDDNVNNDQNQTEEVESTPIVFTATIDGSWEGVSSVGVMIDDTVKEYSVTVSDADSTSATLSSDDPHYWTDSIDITVTAWYPYTEGETTPPDVVVNADQSTVDGFEGSYSISAEEQTVTYDNSILTFTNRTARVTVELTDYTDGLASVKLTNLSADNGNPAEIIPYEYDGENFIYVAIVAPQTVTQGTAFITCEFNDGETFVYEMTDEAEWNAGEEYTYTVSLLQAAGPGYIYDESTNTYTIYNANGLLAWNQAVQDDLSLNCTLSADINLTGIDYEWLQVGNGSGSNRYTGIFDGGGYTITGLTVSQEGSDYVGLIGYLGSDGKVQNLTLENVNISGDGFVGSVAGRIYNGSIVTGCTVSGSVYGSDNNVGGVVGYNYRGTVSACSASGSVSGSGYYVGGVMGYNATYSTMTDCSASCSVTGTDYVGGVVGRNQGTVTDCSASGSVSGTAYVGGVVGDSRGTVTACYASGSVTASDTYANAGGVVGRNYGTVTACYHASGSVTGNTQVGGVVGNNLDTVTACYWSDYDGDGTGNGSGETTEVDGEDVTWSNAVDSMNAAIDTWNTDNTDEQCDWKYVLTGELPTLTKVE